MDVIKESFRKVKEDMDFLKEELDFLRQQIKELKTSLNTSISTRGSGSQIPTNPSLSSTDSKDIPTHNFPFNPLKPLISGISSGNEGVPTDKQTNQQTNQHTKKSSMEGALELLNSLDNIKKEIRLKFKDLTEQEFLVFSMIYQLDEEQGYSNYRILSQKLSLSESSVRDYVGKLIKKEIPVDKIRINNKNVKLSVSKNLKKIVSLNTILQLREL